MDNVSAAILDTADYLHGLLAERGLNFSRRRAIILCVAASSPRGIPASMRPSCLPRWKGKDHGFAAEITHERILAALQPAFLQHARKWTAWSRCSTQALIAG